ncbi:SIR2-domain-containing protein [Byssothecium circinans]|uniref:SIR2-domain-containing protein n=1 Tax=Byssothecium circinans TaxID=147558 RepID=A0A6A5U540_9PLEO|nr:SIR2-domain-containing protein [Byssothecium circinans]
MSASTVTGSVLVQDPVSVPGIDMMAEAESAKPNPNASASAQDDDSEDDAWENESLLEDLLAQSEETFEYSANDDCVTPAQALRIRQRLREEGADKFVLEYITSGRYTARKLCTAFGITLPGHAADVPDESFYRILGLAINRELNKRQRLDEYKTIDDAVKLLRERKNIMVITGAGISTSLGIPDFRSKNTGFYSKLLDMGYDEPEQVFDLHEFDRDPSIFYKLAGEIIPDLTNWTPTHEFIRLVQDKDKLLTNYTQNIDNVESHAGIKREKLIQCHGSWAWATCRKCGHKVPGVDIFDAVRAHKPAECKQCIELIATQKTGMKRKRSSNGSKSSSKQRRRASEEDSDSDGAYDIPQPGIMKPDITFFGEQLPGGFFDRLKEVDRDKVDLVIVMGTSMKVAPVSEIPNYLPPDVPQIYISRDPIHHINFDINLLGDCDTVVAELARRAGWCLNHKMLPKNQQVDVKLVDEIKREYTLTVQSPMKESMSPVP